MTARNCRNCGHCMKTTSGFVSDICLLSGMSIEVTRRMSLHLCDESFSGWVPRDSKVFLAITQALLFILVVLSLLVFVVNLLRH